MVIFNSYVKLPEGRCDCTHFLNVLFFSTADLQFSSVPFPTMTPAYSSSAALLPGTCGSALERSWFLLDKWQVDLTKKLDDPTGKYSYSKYNGKLDVNFRLEIPFFCSVWVWSSSTMSVMSFIHDMGMGQNLVPLVNIKIAGKWMFIPLKMYL